MNRQRIDEAAPIRAGEEPDAELRRVTHAVNDALSRAILLHPEQWLWSSRRFLTRPPGESPGPDGLPPRWAASAVARGMPDRADC